MDRDVIEKITEEIYDKVMTEIEEESGVSKSTASQNTTLSSEARNIASKIDHTILSPDATVEEIKQVCAEAAEYNFASVCVNPDNITLVYEELKNNNNVKVCSVIGFPLGATTTKAKVSEAKEVMEKGAQEIDMVMNVGALKSGKFDKVKRDIEEVVIAARGRALVKVIIEACLLTDGEKVKACSLAKVAGADFVKTSTGFSSGGATIEDVELMRETVGSEMGVKASGGIRDYKKAKAMIDAGATRIGASGSVEIVKGEKSTKNY